MADGKTYEWRDPGRATAWAVGILAADMVVHLGVLALEATLGSASSYAAAPSAIMTDPFKFLHWLLDLAQVLLLFGAIGLVAWILRISRNAHTLTTRRLEKPWWAALWWYVIPIMTLFKPYGAMGEIWDVSASSPAAGQPRRAAIGVWWAASVVSNGLGWVSSRYPGEIALDGAYRLAALIVCGALIIIALRIRDMQREKHVAQAFSDPGQDRPLSVLERING